MRKISSVLIALMLLTNIWAEGTAFGAEVPSQEENSSVVTITVDAANQVETAVVPAQQAAEAETAVVLPAQTDNRVVIETAPVESAPVAEETEAVQEEEQGTHVYIGHFTITHYCICSRCCGKSASNPAYGITATGTRATPARTIAVDPRVIPYGTQVIINDHIYVAEDCGGAIKQNRIDVLVTSHSEALRKGVLRSVPVYVVI